MSVLPASVVTWSGCSNFICFLFIHLYLVAESRRQSSPVINLSVLRGQLGGGKKGECARSRPGGGWGCDDCHVWVRERVYRLPPQCSRCRTDSVVS
ncbi:hypothetical protein LY76DRAFT_365222 [Colletotrichum caudatum]|nr:hypothetical protein LY76DRAFT_365222 [Colletotrichum caudatum]